MTPFESVEVGGLRIAFERVGAGAPVVLLHGGLSDRREWKPQRPLADTLTLVAWDAPGCGASSDPPESFRMPDYAAVLAGFIDSVEMERPHVVGLSFGATLALALFRHDPSVPRSLVLASPYAGWAGSLPPGVVAERLESGLQALDRGPHALARDFVETLFTGRADPDAVAEIEAMMSDVRPAGARAMLHAMAECDLTDVLPRIDVPVLVVHGAEDVRSPPHIASALNDAIPGSAMTVLPGAGHQCNVERPVAFNRAVRAFLRKVDDR